MQINKVELELQFVELLPERETLFFNTWKGNFSNVTLGQSATAVNVGLLNAGAQAGNLAGIEVVQVNA